MCFKKFTNYKFRQYAFWAMTVMSSILEIPSRTS